MKSPVDKQKKRCAKCEARRKALKNAVSKIFRRKGKK